MDRRIASTSSANNIQERVHSGDVKKNFNKLMNPNFVSPIHHNAILSHNLQSNSVVESMEIPEYQQLPFFASYPIPYAINMWEKTVSDYCLQDVIDKQNWKFNVNAMKQSYKHVPLGRRIKSFKTKSSRAKIPLYLLKFSKLLLNDPDPYFDCDYNWYCSGNGNLCKVTIDGKKYVIKSTEKTVYVHQNSNNIGIEASCKFDVDNTIYETVFVQSSKLNVIGIRQKFCISILSVVNTVTEIERIHKLESKYPIVGFYIDQDLNIYYSCVDGAIYFNDISSNQTITIQPSVDRKIMNNWSMFNFFDNKNFVYITGKKLKIIDKRKNVDTEIKLTNTMECETVSASRCHSNNSNYFYISTRHSMQLCDIRFGDGDHFNFTKKWIHGLSTPPIYLKTISIASDELICLGNQNMNDVSLVFDSNDCSEIYPVWKPRMLSDTFNLVQKKGYCLDPTINMKKRLYAPRTGIELIENKVNYNLYSLNTPGDVFYQSISYYEPDTDEDDLCDLLKSYADAIPTKNSLLATGEIDFTNCYNRIRCRHQVKSLKHLMDKDSLLKSKRWINKLEFMRKCKDLFADEFLRYWEMNDEDFEIDPSQPDKISTNQNIAEWMVKVEMDFD